MLVKSKTTCKCSKCKTNIYRGNFKFSTKKILCWDCGINPNRSSNDWIINLVKYSSFYKNNILSNHA